jgi:hypothetical protein
MNVVPVARDLGDCAVIERTCTCHPVRRATRSPADVDRCALEPYG